MTKVLVADDQRMVRVAIEKLLTNRGFEVFVACDGREAVESAAKVLPDIIILDMHMPELSGWEACAKIRAVRSLRCTPIIALTAYSLPADKIRAETVGCSLFLAKPIQVDRLLAEIKRLLPFESPPQLEQLSKYDQSPLQ